MRFSVFTHVQHIRSEKSIYAYSPYVREMKLWFSQADEVEIVAPISSGNCDSISIPYQYEGLIFKAIPSFHVLSLKGSIKALFKIPFIIYKVFGAMYRSDHIHLRCPGNIGFIACFVQMFFPQKAKTVKYAGNWDPNSRQPLSYRLQKWLLSNTLLSKNIKVLVYGEWQEQSNNIVPFFTSSFSETEKGLYSKNFTSPFKFIFVGSLSAGKRPLFAIKLMEALMAKGIPVKLEIYGSGVLKNELQGYINTKNLTPFVQLMGNRKLEELKEVYKASHFLILASRSEGWPKAVAEAMFFGCIPIATPVSCVPWMLGDGSRGILALPASEMRTNEKEWIENLVNRIIELIEDVGEMKRKSLEAQKWSQEYTLEKFEEGIKKVLIKEVRP